MEPFLSGCLGESETILVEQHRFLYHNSAENQRRNIIEPIRRWLEDPPESFFRRLHQRHGPKGSGHRDDWYAVFANATWPTSGPCHCGTIILDVEDLKSIIEQHKDPALKIIIERRTNLDNVYYTLAECPQRGEPARSRIGGQAPSNEAPSEPAQDTQPAAAPTDLKNEVAKLKRQMAEMENAIKDLKETQTGEMKNTIEELKKDQAKSAEEIVSCEFPFIEPFNTSKTTDRCFNADKNALEAHGVRLERLGRWKGSEDGEGCSYDGHAYHHQAYEHAREEASSAR